MSIVPEPVPPEREPLPEITPAAAYPVDALGPLLGDAAKAIAKRVQAPVVLAAQSVLAAASFLAQSRADIVHEGRTIPLSLFLLSIAESGDRKTSTDRVAVHPVEEWQRQRHRDHIEEARNYNDQQEVYKAAREAAKANSRKSGPEAHSAALAELEPPIPPEGPQVIVTEPTLEGLHRSFRHGRPSQALFTSEGGEFFGGHALHPDRAVRSVSLLSLYWDGAPIVRTRGAEGESSALYGRRLAVHLMAQPIVASSVLSDRLMQEQGLLARFLVAECASIAGTRLKDVSKPSPDPKQHPAVIRLHKRMEALLQEEPEQDDTGALILPRLALDPAAHRAWAEGYNAVERQQAPGCDLEVVRPSAGKAAENALRIAGVLAIVEGAATVSADHVVRGWTLAGFYLQTVLRQAQAAEATALDRAAHEVLQWIVDHGGAAAIEVLQKQVTPARHRKSVGHLRTVLHRLEESNKVVVTQRNTRGEPSAWRVSP